MTSRSGRDKAGHYVVAVERAPETPARCGPARASAGCSSRRTPDAARQNVSYRRLDTSAQPGRFVAASRSIRPTEPRVRSFSGYAAYTPGQPGHVFEVAFDPAAGTATWTDLSFNLGDQPITDVVFRRRDRRPLRVDGLQRPPARGRRERAGRGRNRSAAGRDLRAHIDSSARSCTRPRTGARLVGRTAVLRIDLARTGLFVPRSLCGRRQADGFVTVRRTLGCPRIAQASASEWTIEVVQLSHFEPGT